MADLGLYPNWICMLSCVFENLNNFKMWRLALLSLTRSLFVLFPQMTWKRIRCCPVERSEKSYFVLNFELKFIRKLIVMRQ